jgi:hypothetical protein
MKHEKNRGLKATSRVVARKYHGRGSAGKRIEGKEHLDQIQPSA